MKQTFHVDGMTCEHCEKAVVRAIKQLDRAALVQADRLTKRVEVVSGGLTTEVLRQAITDEGYRVVD